MRTLQLFLFCLALASGHVVCGAEKLLIADNGKTQYRIVTAEKLSKNDKLALKELKRFLRKSTGVWFKKISPVAASKYQKLIVLGKNKLSRELLGGKLLDSLADDEALVKSIETKIILVGGGKNGTLYAVYEFLENQLGCRWYTAYGDIKVPKLKSVVIPELDYRVKLPFNIRSTSMYFYPMRPERDYFFARNRQNDGFSGTFTYLNFRKWLSPVGHTLSYYIPAHKNPYGWRKNLYQGHKENYFKTNPDFFSIAKNGKRTPGLQLCFSNPALRKEFTKNVLASIKYGGGKGRIAVDANDVPGSFCYCPKCQKLEKKYRSIIGPMLDYILELSSVLKNHYPEITISFLAYRKNQTEVPPAVNKLPDNIIVKFAEIDDDFAKPMTNKTNLGTLKNFKRWRKITSNLISRGYVNPYCNGWFYPPYGNIELLVKKVRLAHKLKLFGLTPEHTAGTWWGVNFSDLQTWLFLQLCRNPEANVKKMVKEFTDYYYGAAAALIREYMNDLESLRKQMSVFMSWNPNFSKFRYLTPTNIVKWEKMFDKMIKLTADNPKKQLHVNITRLTLDIAALKIWHKLKKEYPQYKTDAKTIIARVRKNFAAMAEARNLHTVYMKSFNQMFDSAAILATARIKPLPKIFNGISKDKIFQVFPVKKYVKTSDSACGLAIVKKWKKTPVYYGLYDSYNKRFLYPGKIELKDIKPGKYHFYKLGRIKLSQDCVIWLTKAWLITFHLDQLYVPGYPDKEWDLYVSLKFEGPAFDKNSKAKESTISFDRTVAVSIN